MTRLSLPPIIQCDLVAGYPRQSAAATVRILQARRRPEHTRNISVGEVEEALLGRSEVIEDYPDDKRGPTCLVLGFTNAGRPLHVQVSHPSRPVLKVVTLYEPDQALWADFRRRKSPR